MSITRHSQSGFAIAAAVFILVLLATLALAITMMSTQTQTSHARDTLGSRAYQAAKAGLDWGAYQVLDPANTTATSGSANLPNCPGVGGSVCPTAAAPSSSAMPTTPFNGSVLAGISVTLACSCADFTEVGRNIRVYQLRATATSGSGAAAIERQLSARVAYCRDPNGNPAAQPPYGCF
jgi:MSHA biogenesis protein MshP